MQKVLAVFVAAVLSLSLWSAETEVQPAQIMKVVVQTNGQDTIVFTDKAIAWRNGVMIYEGSNEIFVLANGKQVDKSYAPSKPSMCSSLSCMNEENAPMGLLKLMVQYPTTQTTASQKMEVFSLTEKSVEKVKLANKYIFGAIVIPAVFKTSELTAREKELGAIRLSTVGTEIHCVKEDGSYFIRENSVCTGPNCSTCSTCATCNRTSTATSPTTGIRVDECLRCKECSDPWAGAKSFFMYHGR